MSDLVKSKRVVTFVPAANANEFAKTMAAHIPHLFGEYDSVCWWSAPKMEDGTEQFRPLVGDVEQTPSVRMEFSIPDDDAALKNFTATLKKHHLWQEPVIFIFDIQIIHHQ